MTRQKKVHNTFASKALKFLLHIILELRRNNEEALKQGKRKIVERILR